MGMTKERYAKLKQDPERYAAYRAERSEYSKAVWQAVKANPELHDEWLAKAKERRLAREAAMTPEEREAKREKERQRSREKYRKLRNDPVRWAEHLKKCRDKRREK